MQKNISCSSFQRSKAPREEVANIVLAILKDGDIVKVPLLQRHVEEAIKESTTSGIHVWDYLCFLPVKDYVDTIFSCDFHFQKIGGYKVKVVNPLNLWLLL
ncbi:hypothetical protein [Candidatus Methanodesulfokora washburnensis]|uniref:PIN domain-containing protein n=1 Tax=Candidatus Methanodesulfokora washburnensis TaxID=2478471 RepID=A0A429GD17_9CREN|nr:hypothetical protein [Candidatus Methanodesulfokores washburnensis]RSN71714.1 hypothetical protein D6D85_15385 [Candidatus Methanodesulfokores washburnensis]